MFYPPIQVIYLAHFGEDIVMYWVDMENVGMYVPLGSKAHQDQETLLFLCISVGLSNI